MLKDLYSIATPLHITLDPPLYNNFSNKKVLLVNVRGILPAPHIRIIPLQWGGGGWVPIFWLESTPVLAGGGGAPILAGAEGYPILA